MINNNFFSHHAKSQRAKKYWLLAFCILNISLNSISWCETRLKDADILMKSVKTEGNVLPQIIGGNKLRYEDWPATRRFRKPNSNYSCTATIVGSRVLITAAHCLANVSHAKVENGDTYTVVECENHPNYKPYSADIALCAIAEITDQDFHAIGGFENINLSPLVTKDTQLFLQGFGCRENMNDKSAGQLYGGLSLINKLPSRDTDDYVTLGGVRICQGDSGGAAFLLTDTTDPNGKRFIIGVNSTDDGGNRSNISSLPNHTDWIEMWGPQHRADICGVQPLAKHCR